MIIINDKVEEEEKINFDSGYYFGRGVFETILIKETPILLKEHLKRLNLALNKLKINKYIDEEYFINTLNKTGWKNCVVRLMVSEENVVFLKREIFYTLEQYEEGFSLNVSDMKRNPYSHMTYMKSFNYYDNIIEREVALEKGFQEALFLNTDDYVAEGAISNIFFMKNNKIHTPSIDCGILPGVVRNFLLYKLSDMYDIEEGKYTLKDFFRADGVFITNSIMGVMKVNKIGDEIIEESNHIEDIRNYYREYAGII